MGCKLTMQEGVANGLLIGRLHEAYIGHCRFLEFEINSEEFVHWCSPTEHLDPRWHMVFPYSFARESSIQSLAIYSITEKFGEKLPQESGITHPLSHLLSP